MSGFFLSGYCQARNKVDTSSILSLPPIPPPPYLHKLAVGVAVLVGLVTLVVAHQMVMVYKANKKRWLEEQTSFGPDGHESSRSLLGGRQGRSSSSGHRKPIVTPS